MSDHLEPQPPLGNPYATPSTPAFTAEDSYFQKLRKQLDAAYHKLATALAIEQVRGDELRKELGVEPLGPQRTYSGFEIEQGPGLVVVPFSGGGITTRIES